MFTKSLFDGTTSRRRGLQWRIHLIVGFLIAFTLLLVPKAEAEKVSAWTLTVRHSYFFLCKAVISESKASFTTGTFAFTLLPPDYTKVYVVNPGGGLFLETTVDKWFISRWRKENIFPKYVRKGEATICGLKCAHYLCLDSGGITRADLWTTTAIPAKRAMADAYCTICGLPVGLGIPIRFSMIHPNSGYLVKTIDTVSAAKKLVSSETAFLPPTFKRATDRYALFVSSSGNLEKSDLEDLFMSHQSKTKDK